jgi:hypothetical protein
VATKSNVLYKGRFEGDDGVVAILGGEMDVSLFARLGMKIDLQKVSDLSEASFCGLIFDPTELNIITNPIKVLANFAWGKGRYRSARQSVLLQLLKAKALSFMHQYPACPIVTELARYALRMTRNITIRKSIIDQLDSFERGRLLDAMACPDLDANRPIRMGTRCLMERVFGVSVEIQFQVEELFKHKLDLEPVSIPHIDWPEGLVDYAVSYVLDWPVGDDNYIGEWWGKIPHYKEW